MVVVVVCYLDASYVSCPNTNTKAKCVLILSPCSPYDKQPLPPLLVASHVITNHLELGLLDTKNYGNKNNDSTTNYR